MVAGYSFLVFNLLCAPCFAAIGAIKREMNNAKWTWFAIGYQCGLAYAVALMVNQIGSAFTGNLNAIGLLAAIAVLGGMLYMLFRPYKEAYKTDHKHETENGKINSTESTSKDVPPLDGTPRSPPCPESQTEK